MKISSMKVNCYVDDDVKFVFVNIVSIIVSIKVVSFDFILKSFVSVIIFEVENVIHHSFVFFWNFNWFENFRYLIVDEVLRILFKQIEMKDISNCHWDRQLHFIWHAFFLTFCKGSAFYRSASLKDELFWYFDCSVILSHRSYIEQVCDVC